MKRFIIPIVALAAVAFVSCDQECDCVYSLNDYSASTTKDLADFEDYNSCRALEEWYNENAVGTWVCK